MLVNIKLSKKVITTLKDRIGHPLERHLTEISTRVNNFKDFRMVQFHDRMGSESHLIECSPSGSNHLVFDRGTDAKLRYTHWVVHTLRNVNNPF